MADELIRPKEKITTAYSRLTTEIQPSLISSMRDFFLSRIGRVIVTENGTICKQMNKKPKGRAFLPLGDRVSTGISWDRRRYR